VKAIAYCYKELTYFIKHYYCHVKSRQIPPKNICSIHIFVVKHIHCTLWW